MAPILEIETESEKRQGIGERHRVVIAAVVAVLLGSPEDPPPSGWKHCGRIRIAAKPARKEERRETSHHD